MAATVAVIQPDVVSRRGSFKRPADRGAHAGFSDDSDYLESAVSRPGGESVSSSGVHRNVDRDGRREHRRLDVRRRFKLAYDEP
jgi:hypothetical protein